MAAFYLEKHTTLSQVPIVHLLDYLSGYNTFTSYKDELKAEHSNEADYDKVLEAVINCLYVSNEQNNTITIDNGGSYSYTYYTEKFSENKQVHKKLAETLVKKLKIKLDSEFVD